MGHALVYTGVHSMGHGVLFSHILWVIPHPPRLWISHDPWEGAPGHGKLIFHGACTVHPLSKVQISHDPWSVHWCTLHGLWKINFPWGMLCTLPIQSTNFPWPMEYTAMFMPMGHGKLILHGTCTVHPPIQSTNFP